MCIRDSSLIIGYAPCELHGVKGGMTNCQNEMKKAVEAGYWNLFTFNPVSYTHLDVYKRQVLHISEHKKTPCKIFASCRA